MSCVPRLPRATLSHCHQLMAFMVLTQLYRVEEATTHNSSTCFPIFQVFLHNPLWKLSKFSTCITFPGIKCQQFNLCFTLYSFLLGQKMSTFYLTAVQMVLTQCQVSSPMKWFVNIDSYHLVTIVWGSQVWRCLLVIPATLKMEAGRLCSESSLGRNARPYLKNKWKEWKGWHKW
jgi:hypothetical protein